MINPHICAQCDSENRSCCTLRAENNEGLPAPVSEPEVVRILGFMENKEVDDFLDKRENSAQLISQMTFLFPDMANAFDLIFPLGGNHMELKTKDDACIFQGNEGCVLPNDVRPHFCRIYPFWFFKGEPHIFQDSNCLALEKNRTIPEVLLSLGTNADSIKRLHATLCEDWGIYRSMPQGKKMVFL